MPLGCRPHIHDRRSRSRPAGTARAIPAASCRFLACKSMRPRWPFIRQRFQENRVNQVEDGAIGADAQRQNESRARVEQRRTPGIRGWRGRHRAGDLRGARRRTNPDFCSWIRAGAAELAAGGDARLPRGSALARRTHPSTARYGVGSHRRCRCGGTEKRGRKRSLSFLNTSGLHQDGGNGAAMELRVRFPRLSGFRPEAVSR